MSWIARRIVLVCSLALLLPFLVTCGSPGSTTNPLLLSDLAEHADAYSGRDVTVDAAYIWRPGNPATSILAVGMSTLENGLDAQPIGAVVWVENFPADVTASLHRPGDAVYGFVRVTGTFEKGAFGPNGSYPQRITVKAAEAIEQVRRTEQRIDRYGALPANGIALAELARNPDKYSGQTVTTRGYYYWNSVIWVLAEGISTEEDGSSPQPTGEIIWMEGFPPDLSSKLNVGVNNSYVWGPIEVTGTFQTGGGLGKDGQYRSMLTAQTARVLETK